MKTFREFLIESKEKVYIPRSFNEIQKDALKSIKLDPKEELEKNDGDQEHTVTRLLNSIDGKLISDLSSDEYDQIWEYVTFLVKDL